MGDQNEVRWKQRLESYRNALSQLTRACDQVHYSELERAGLIRTFVITFELVCRVLKDLLFVEGYDIKGPRTVIRHSFEHNLLDETDCEILLDVLENRNVLSHVYRDEVALEAESKIKVSYYPVLLRLLSTLSEKANQ